MTLETKIDDDGHHHDGDGDQKISHTDHHLLEVTALLPFGFGHEAHGATKVGIKSSVDHDTDHFALFDDGIGKGDIVSFFIHRQRLSRQRRLIHQGIIPGIYDLDVGRDDITDLDLDHISWYQLFGRDLLPLAIS